MTRGRQLNLTRPDHASLVGDVVIAYLQGRDQPAIIVRCPKCRTERVRPLAWVRNAIQRGKFTGHCRHCKPPATFVIKEIAQSGPSYKLRNGYIVVREEYARTQEHVYLWRQLHFGCSGPPKPRNVLEHEFIMACVLGHTKVLLHDRYRVRHRDGTRYRNHPNNLVIERRDHHTEKWGPAPRPPLGPERKHEQLVIELYGNGLLDAVPGVSIVPLAPRAEEPKEAYSAPQGLAAAFGKLDTPTR